MKKLIIKKQNLLIISLLLFSLCFCCVSEAFASVSDYNEVDQLGVVASNDVSASLNEEQTCATVTASSSMIQGQEVRLAVWNGQAGQAASLKWFSNFNSYSFSKFDVLIKDFKLSGKYYCDAYLIIDANMTFLGRDDFTVSAITGDSPTVSDKDKTKLSFRANVSNIQSASGVSNIRFAIWSSTSGQDDLVWINGPINPVFNKAYQSSITEYISRHNYQNDLYYIHVYATGKNGVDSWIGSLSETIELVDNEVIANLNDEQTISKVNVSSPLIYGHEVRLAVWNAKAGQTGSLKWFYKFNCYSSSVFDVAIKDFKLSGIYYSDAYLINGNNMIFIGRTTFKVLEIVGDLPVVTDKDKDTLSFKVNVSDIISRSKLSNCTVAVWTSKGGQDDLTWTNLTIEEKGNYTYNATTTINVADHHFENGKYYIHAYATGTNGVNSFIGSIVESIELVEPGYNVVLNNKATIAHAFIVDNILLKSGKLQFAAWSSKKKQQDLKWYNAKVDGNTGYFEIPISDFKQLGMYYVDAYFNESSGHSVFLGRKTFTVESPTLDARILDIDGHTGTFKVEIFNITKLETLSGFSTPTWFNPYGTSTAIWYNAVKQSDLIYSTNPKVSDHRFAFGDYTTHVYANMLNGCQICLKSLQIYIKADNYLGVSRLDVSNYRLCAQGITGQVSDVSFPTWSNGSGQQDIIWYAGRKEGNNVWFADFSAKKHWPDGTFSTHCYAYDAAGTARMVTGIQYVVPKDATDISGNSQLDMIIKNIIRSHPTLNDCFNYVSYSFSYRKGDLWPSGEWTIPYAIELATLGSGNCYRFAALFLWCARGLDYSASAICGKLPNRWGGYNPHGWVEVYLNGQTYVCDPELQNTIPSYNWYMTTYETAPIEYIK